MEAPGGQTTVAQGTAGQTEELARAISAPLLFFYVLGDVLGSGIYALIGVMAAQVGGAFWTSFVVGVAAAMLTGFAYAELITKYPRAAGAALYTDRAFDNRFFTFLVTFCTVAASLAATGALALAFSGYFLELMQSIFLIPLLVAAFVFVVALALHQLPRHLRVRETQPRHERHRAHGAGARAGDRDRGLCGRRCGPRPPVRV